MQVNLFGMFDVCIAYFCYQFSAYSVFDDYYKVWTGRLDDPLKPFDNSSLYGGSGGGGGGNISLNLFGKGNDEPLSSDAGGRTAEQTNVSGAPFASTNGKSGGGGSSSSGAGASIFGSQENVGASHGKAPTVDMGAVLGSTNIPLGPPMMGNPPWLQTAIGELGVREIPGPQSNPRISEYWGTTSTPNRTDNTAWCSAFENWCFRENGIRGTNNGGSKSWRKWGVLLPEPAVGAVAVFQDIGNAKYGHVAFVAGQDQNGKVIFIGGNQSDAVTYHLGMWKGKIFLGYRYPTGFVPNYNLPIINVRYGKSSGTR